VDHFELKSRANSFVALEIHTSNTTVDHFENEMVVIAGVSCFKTEEMPNDLSCVPCLVASGYTSCALGHLFEYAPTEIEYSMKQLMGYLEQLRRGQISHMREIHALYNSDYEEHENAFQSMQSMFIHLGQKQTMAIFCE
jgi:hypothetical protein